MTTSIVTGASRGLGLGIARTLVAAGHDVIAAARTEPAVEGARNVAADITSPGDVRRLVAEAGEIGLLVNNAAAPLVLDSLADITMERFRLGLDVDVVGTLALTQAAVERMGEGTIVNVIAARGGVLVGPPHLAISPSQAALFALTRTLGSILAPRGIVVHGLLPALTPAGATGVAAAPPLGVTFDAEFLTGEQVGDAVLALFAEREPGMHSVSYDSMVTSVPIGV
jgi:NAD(P)-dependent dehydrogenase (short-subunit alcohol dehydrogenase family)